MIKAGDKNYFIYLRLMKSWRTLVALLLFLCANIVSTEPVRQILEIRNEIPQKLCCCVNFLSKKTLRCAANSISCDFYRLQIENCIPFPEWLRGLVQER